MTDAINPSHYQGSIETIDAIEEWAQHWPPEIRFHVGNAVKYLSRLGRKGDVAEQLEKARWYIDRALGVLGSAEPPEPPEPSREPEPGYYVSCGRVSVGPARTLSAVIDTLAARFEDGEHTLACWVVDEHGIERALPFETIYVEDGRRADRDPPKPKVPSWVLPFVSRPGWYAHANGRVVGPQETRGDALSLFAYRHGARNEGTVETHEVTC